MTNEEIIKEITNRHTYVADDIEYSDVMDACREMAEWKDRQFKEYLEHKKAEHKEGEIGYYIFDEIINELFGGESK